jgi:hypothetical protein
LLSIVSFISISIIKKPRFLSAVELFYLIKKTTA